MISQPRGTIIITGSSGLIGRPLLDRLSTDYNVAGFDIVEPPQGQLPESASFHNVDITSDRSVGEALEEIRQTRGEHITSVIHLAAYYDFSGEPSDKYNTITVQGTRRLLRHLRKRFTVEQFIFSSTMLVHAPCEVGERINEDSPLEPKWDYPRSKVETEDLLRRKRGDIPIVLLRIAGVYDDYCNSIPLSHQMQRIYERRMTGKVFPGDILAGQAMIHKDDLIEAFAAAVERRTELPPETALLIGEPETLSYDELQQRFAELIHSETWDTKTIPKAIAKTGAWFQEKTPVGEEPFIKPWMIDLADDHYAMDISRARQLLGWEPRRRLRETLPKMVQAMKAAPLDWYHAHKIEPPRKLERKIARSGAARR